MSAITYYALANYTLNSIKRICVNVDNYDNIKGDEISPQESFSSSVSLSSVAVASNTAKCTIYSIRNSSSYDYGAPPIITSTSLRNLMKGQFLQLGIDIDSTATRTPKEAVHFINAVILFLSYHLYYILNVTGEKDPGYYFNHGNKRAIAFNSGRNTPFGTGLPSITNASKIEDRDLLIETFNSLVSILPSVTTRLGGLDIYNYAITCCSSSSSSSSSSCSSSSCSSSSSSSLFIAYFNI